MIIAGSFVDFTTNWFILTNNLVKLNAYIVIFHSPWVKLTNNLLIHPNNLLKSVTYVAILTVHQRGLVKFTKNMFNTTTNKLCQNCKSISNLHVVNFTTYQYLSGWKVNQFRICLKSGKFYNGSYHLHTFTKIFLTV